MPMDGASTSFVSWEELKRRVGLKITLKAFFVELFGVFFPFSCLVCTLVHAKTLVLCSSGPRGTMQALLLPGLPVPD